MIPGGAAEGEALAAEVVGLRPLTEGDVALLKVQRSNLPASELVTDTGVAVGTSVLSAGFPGRTDEAAEPSLKPVFAGGKINAGKAVGTVPVYQTDATVSEGMSGGPTVDLSGKVLGVNSFGIHGQTQPFTFVAPSRGLAELMSEKGVAPALGPADTAYRAGVEKYFDGDYTAAIADFDEVQSISPDYPGVADLRTSAAQERDRYGDAEQSSGSSPLRYLLAGLGALAVAGLGVLVLRRRVRRTAEDSLPSGGAPSADERG